MDRSKVFIIVPAYNECRVLKATVEPLLRLRYSIVIVDDGSNDSTPDIVTSLPVHSLRHLINLGQGAAIQTGTEYALKKGAEFIVHFDADGQHNEKDIEGVLDPLRKGDAEVVFGSRFLRKEDIKAIPAFRRIILRIGIIVNGFLTGLWLSDAHNGFRALKRHAASKINLKNSGYSHATEIMAQIKKEKLRYTEMPTKIRYSEYSMKKGQNALNGLYIVIDVILRKVFK